MAVPEGGQFVPRPGQCVDQAERRVSARARRGNGHQHDQAARLRPHGAGGAYGDEVHRLRRRAAEELMAIGVFGGTFDPVHVGHLRVAEEVREAFSMERVYFVPARVQPFKQAGSGAAADDRVRMLEMATRGNTFFRTSQVEIRRGGVSYSIDTVKHFARRFGEIYFLVGLDAFSDIGLWKAQRGAVPVCGFRGHGEAGQRGARGFPKACWRRRGRLTPRPASMRRERGSIFITLRSSISRRRG